MCVCVGVWECCVGACRERSEADGRMRVGLRRRGGGGGGHSSEMVEKNMQSTGVRGWLWPIQTSCRCEMARKRAGQARNVDGQPHTRTLGRGWGLMVLLASWLAGAANAPASALAALLRCYCCCCAAGPQKDYLSSLESLNVDFVRYMYACMYARMYV